MASLIIQMTGNENKHSQPNTTTSTRTGHVAPKGSHYIVYAEQAGMYKIKNSYGGYSWISKRYTKVIQDGKIPTTSSGSTGTKENANTPSAPKNVDWVIGAGAGLLLIVIVGKLVKKI